MMMKPVIETGWNVTDGEQAVSTSGALGLAGVVLCPPNPPPRPISTGCGGGGGLSSPACPGSPLGCNELTSVPGVQN